MNSVISSEASSTTVTTTAPTRVELGGVDHHDGDTETCGDSAEFGGAGL
jgi:hypothetical protein